MQMHVWMIACRSHMPLDGVHILHLKKQKYDIIIVHNHIEIFIDKEYYSICNNACVSAHCGEAWFKSFSEL